jgi:hypothetical protein
MIPAPAASLFTENSLTAERQSDHRKKPKQNHHAINGLYVVWRAIGMPFNFTPMNTGAYAMRWIAGSGPKINCCNIFSTTI